MKKLMIAAATAALAAGAFAAEPQVYEMTLTVKSTQCATGKKTVKVCDDIEFTSYRKQVTRKYEGLFWGCGCEVIACPTYYFKGLDFDHDTVAPNQETDYIFWSSTKGFQYGLYGDDDAFQWQILQLVGPKAANIEGTWTLVLKNSADEIVLDVAGAGYGTAFDICKDGDTKIKSMSGYVVGSVDYAAEAEVSGCQYCGELTECTPFQFCECIDVQDKTALFGSWSLKYNSSAAKKLAQGKYIESAYKFPKYLNLGNYTDGEGEGEATDTVKTAAEAAYKTAKEAYETAKAAVEAAEAKQSEAADTEAALTAKKPTGTTEGLALAKTYSDAQAATKEAKDAKDETDGDVTATKAALDTTMSGDEYSGKVKDFIDKSNTLTRAQETLEEEEAATVGKDGKYTTQAAKDAAIAAAKTGVQTAQEAYNTAKKTYEDAYAALAPSSQKDSNAYKTALEAQTTAQNAFKDAEDAEKEALQAIKDWTSGDDKNEKSQAYAKAQAEKNLETLKADANSKEQIMATYRSQCIAVGGSCD